MNLAHKNYIIKDILKKNCTNSNKTLLNIVLKYHIDQCNIFGDISLLMIPPKTSQTYNSAIFKNNKSRDFDFIEF